MSVQITSPIPQAKKRLSTTSICTLDQEPPCKKMNTTTSENLSSPIVALPSPALHPTSNQSTTSPSLGATPVGLTAPPGGHVTYIPVYPASHGGHFYIASPPLQQSPHQHPMSPTKILPKVVDGSAHYTLYPAYQLPPAMTSPPAATFMGSPTSTTSSPTAAPVSTTTADQREQARKVSHSAIERRRRERINDKIMQLKQLIPTCANQDHLHKMSILQSAIEYITYLKQVLEQIDQADGSASLRHLDAIHGKMQAVKTTKSLLPKEVEPYTSQFNAGVSRPTKSPLATALPTPTVTPTHPSSRSPSPPKAMSVKDLLC
ncbi:HLH-domain-containing protein [Hesseltinella vesiculosa]|uniref:HLH-domain-containing protein n=1 Tax=Hesseltinella vesiculosa TaxID=101127 RepID=A0A1X2GX97_9FUNG|nr:HLH-domain-containing protein [Hesseltinella vesiculosa]